MSLGQASGKKNMGPKGVLVQQATSLQQIVIKIQSQTNMSSQEDDVPDHCCTSRDQEPLLQQLH